MTDSPLTNEQKAALLEISQGNIEGTLDALAEICERCANESRALGYEGIESYYRVRKNVIEEAIYIIEKKG